LPEKVQGYFDVRCAVVDSDIVSMLRNRQERVDLVSCEETVLVLKVPQVLQKRGFVSLLAQYHGGLPENSVPLVGVF
jgi:ribosomal protein S8